jgi:hypothetical protein
MATLPLTVRLDQIFDSIDRLTSVEIEARPGASRGRIHFLYDAARERAGAPLCRAAAEALVDAAKSGGPVLLSNGWVIDFWYPHGEICGMIGAAALARTITLGLKTQVRFLGEEPVLPVFEAVLRAAGLRLYSPEHLETLPNVVGAEAFPLDPKEAKAASHRLLEQLRPSAVITIEKCAPNSRGVYHTGRGIDMSATTAKVGVLVSEARRRGILTIGIGDLGNEIGFGGIRAVVEEHIPFGRECVCGCGGGIASDVETDCLIVASSSNRGGYALEAALAALLADPALMHDGEMDKRMILAARDAGAIDSFTVGPTSTDGHGVDMHYSACLVELLRQIVLSRDAEFPLFAKRA